MNELSDEFRIKKKIKDKCNSISITDMIGIYYESGSLIITLDGTFDWKELRTIAKVLHDEVNNL